MLPISIRITNKPVVVVGGGKVAARRVKTLLAERANVTVVSPMLHEPLQTLYKEGAFVWENRPFHASDVEQKLLVIAATNHREVNAHVLACCQEHQFINIVDSPENSTFHFPAVAQRGLLNIAVSTNGASPVLARKIRDDLAAQFDDEFIDYITFVKETRALIVQSETQPLRKKVLLQQLIEQPLKTAEQQQQFLKGL